MHISLTPELEAIIKEKITSGLYNNASEVICESLRFMKTNEELVEGELDLIEGRYTDLNPDELSNHFQIIKNRAMDRVKQDKKILC